MLSYLPLDEFVPVESADEARQGADRFEMAFRLSTLGEIEIIQGNYASAQAYYEESLGHYNAIARLFFAARALQRIAMCRIGVWDSEGFAVYAQAGLDGSRTLGDVIGMANCLYNLGSAAGMEEDFTAENTYYQEALVLRRQIGDRASVAVNLGGLGMKAFQQGNAREAWDWAHQAMELAEDINYNDGKAFALSMLGLVAGLEEDYARCQALCERARSLTVNPIRVAFVECGLMIAACGLGDFESAQAHSRWLLKHSEAMQPNEFKRWGMPGYAVWFANLGQMQRALEVIAVASKDSDVNPKWFDGWPLFTRLRTQLKRDLPPEQAAAAWARGTSTTLDTLIANLLSEPEMRVALPAGSLPRQPLEDPLSERELDVLRLVASGLSNTEIADQLVIGGSTVKKHINHIFSKLDAQTRVQAIRRAEQLRLL